jgi:hypothetical protein
MKDEERFDKIKYACLSMDQAIQEAIKQGSTSNQALRKVVPQWFEETMQEQFPDIDPQVVLVVKGTMVALLATRDVEDADFLNPFGLNEISKAIFTTLTVIYKS